MFRNNNDKARSKYLKSGTYRRKVLKIRRYLGISNAAVNVRRCNAILEAELSPSISEPQVNDNVLIGAYDVAIASSSQVDFQVSPDKQPARLASNSDTDTNTDLSDIEADDEMEKEWDDGYRTPDEMDEATQWSCSEITDEAENEYTDDEANTEDIEREK